MNILDKSVRLVGKKIDQDMKALRKKFNIKYQL
jgi:hypothetical protein